MPATNNDLSERELEILRLVATGASNKEIAQRLFISANTVKVHLRNIFGKINVTSRTEAAMYAVNAGLVPSTALAGAAEAESGLQDGGAASAQAEAMPGESRLVASRLPRTAFYALAFAAVILLGLVGYFSWLLTRPKPPSLPAIAQSTWKTLASVPTPRSGLAVTVYQNRFYVIGGEAEQGVTGVFEEYDPMDDTWAVLPEKPLAVADAGAAILGGKIYIPGGRTASGEVTDVLEIYDPGQGKWSKGTPLPSGVSAYALATFEGKLYLFGGWDGQQVLSSVLEYDPDQDEWNQRTPLTTPRAYAGAAAVGEKIFLMGGYDGKEALDLNEAYAPNLDNYGGKPWSTESPLPGGRYRMGISSVMDLVCLVGGVDEKGSALPALGFLTRTGEWQSIVAPGLEGWSDLGLASLGGEIYALGGKIDQKPTDSNLSYQVIYITVLPFVR